MSVIWLARFSVLFGVLFSVLFGVAHAFDNEAVYTAFSRVFKFRDGSSLLVGSNTSVFEVQALDQLSYIGVTGDVATFCAKSEVEILEVLMKAALGNLIMGTVSDGCHGPFVVDAVSGKLERVESLQNNRVLVFEVLVFALLLALARSWYVMYTRQSAVSDSLRKSL